METKSIRPHIGRWKIPFRAYFYHSNIYLILIPFNFHQSLIGMSQEEFAASADPDIKKSPELDEHKGDSDDVHEPSVNNANDDKTASTEVYETEAKVIPDTDNEDIETNIDIGNDVHELSNNEPAQTQKEEIKETLIEETIQYSSPKPYQLNDILITTPFKLSDLNTSKITCIEAWELNLYVGTSAGEIIHLYKIDDILGYIQISRQEFSSSSSSGKPVKKIIVLPEISIALIHCGSTVSGYLLPELSPANIGKAKDVTDISLDWNDLKLDQSNHNRVTKKEDYYGEPYVNITIFTKKSIKLLRIFADSIRLHKELQYNNIVVGLQVSNFSFVSSASNYDLVDISKSQKILLFPISTTDTVEAQLTPIIKYVKDGELLLVCGGRNRNDPAVGMFINLNGDVVRGTLAFDSYPMSIEIDYPYVVVSLENNNIQIYSIHDQKKLQQIKFNKSNLELQLHECSRIFKVKDPQLAQKITLAPIVSTMDNEEIERIAIEADNAVKKAVCASSCLLYDTSGTYFQLLKSPSSYERWMDIYKTSNKDNYLSIYDKLTQEIHESNSNKFLIALLGFFTLEFKMYDQAFNIWTTNFKYLDPRLMIFIFRGGDDDGIYGSVWTYQILFDKVEYLRKEVKTDKCQDFFKLYLDTCLTINFKHESIPITKSIEIALIKLGISNNENLEPIIHEIKYSSNEVIELLLLNKRYYMLSKFYSNHKDSRQLLYYWKGLIDGEFQDEEFEKNFPEKNKALQFFVNYILANCIADNVIIERYAEWLLEQYPKFGLKLVTDRRVTQLEINDIKILNLLDIADKKSKLKLKLEYLEYIFENKNEKQFLGDLVLIYLDMVISIYDSDFKVRKIIDDSIDDYLGLSIPKLSIYKYWKVIKNTGLEDVNAKFIKYHDRLYNYLDIIGNGMKSVLDQQLVIKKCKEKIIESKYKNIFPLIAMRILYKLNDYTGIVKEFIYFKDYTTAEEFAVSLKLESIGMKSSIASIELENKSKYQQTNYSSSIVNDETLTPTITETKNMESDEKIRENLLKTIFDIYLQTNETKLIDNFLNKYDLLKDTTRMNDSTIDRMDKFVEVLNKVPENFPLDKLKRFMVNNLIEFKDYNDNVNIKKSLVKVQVNQLSKYHKKLSRDI